MLDISITKIIKIDDPKKFKFHAARWNNTWQPLDIYVRDKKEWFDWNRWREKRDDFARQYIFSLIDFYTETDMWLFGGIYEVLERKNINQSYSYEIKELTEYSAYVGRLKVKLKKPPRGRAFCLEHHFEKMMVSEILKQPYSGDNFVGYEKIHHSFEILSLIFKNEKLDWKSALENIKGVYAIIDQSNGKAYIGSAYGDLGIWARWSCYIGTGHGYNDELTSLIQKEGFEYAKKNFKFVLLEYRSMKVDDKIIIERENYWKEVFISRGQFGYNKN